MPINEKQKFVLFFYNDYESLGLEYVSASLKNAGIKTSLIYKNIVDFYAFSDIKLKSRDIALEICDHKPEILALSLLTDTFQINLSIADEVKKLNPEIKILAGGVHASLLPQLTLNNSQIDAVCIGEGEYSTLEYIKNVDAISRGESPVINGILYKQKDKIIGDPNKYVMHKDLDSLPFPDKDLFYDQDPSMKSHYFVQCSRGCPFICTYCINDFLSRKVAGNRFRYRNPELVIEELIKAKEKYSFSFVVFVDECFGAKIEWVRKFLTMYKEKIGAPFLASVHPNLVTPELADLMKEANCWYVAMGVQSLNERVSKEVLKRPIRNKRIAEAISIFRSRNITLQCDHIFGIPGEDENDMVDALSFYNENRPSLVSVYWLSYYPMSQITDYAKKIGILSENDIKQIEHGKIASGIKNVLKHQGINFWLNYFVFFPKWLICLIIRLEFYRLFSIKNYYISSALPRALHAIFHKKDWNRYYMKRIIKKRFNNLRIWECPERS